MCKMDLKRFFLMTFLLVPIFLFGQIRKFNPVYFEQNSDTIELNYYSMLDSMGEYLQSNPSFELRLNSYGHPTERNFKELVWKRAKNIREYLEKNYKIKVADIIETNTNNRGVMPRSDESYLESERAALRKVEFEIAKTKWEYGYNITGQVIDNVSKVFLDECKIKIFSTTNFTREMLSDSMGRFRVEDISLANSTILFEVERNGFYEEKFLMKWESIPHDTAISIELVPIPSSMHWLPEIYFEANSSTPDSSFQETIAQIADLIKSFSSDPNFSLSIIGYKDSLETNDLRLERAKFVFDALVEKGIEKTRLRIESSDASNILKPTEDCFGVRTNKFSSTAITEEFITNSPIAKRDSLRRLNRCVAFRVNR